MQKDEFTGLEVAVIGMSLKFPQADGPEGFWENLKNGKESIKFFTEQELDELGVGQPLRNNPLYVKTGGGLIEDKEYFDAAFFGYTPEEAILMNPQTRIFHEISWMALEDSGYDVTRYGGRIGLFAGSSNSFNWEALTVLSGSASNLGDFASTQLSSKDFLTTKVSYKLNLKGPSVPVQTACSTSLVAVHLAARSLLLGECDLALAGGVTISSEKEKGYVYQEGMILSKDGHCRTFDAEASGTNSGNGAGVVVLKLLRKAIEDKDHIYAIIKGSAINNDGNRKTGYTAPSVRGQVEVIRSAMNFAKVDAKTIQYVECHGTGTNLGDPIELEALKQAFSNVPAQHCGISCVKSNIGHLDSAAGIAGFIKAVLSLKHKYLVPSINYQSPNPKFNLEKSPFYVVNELRAWDRNGFPRRAGVSSFGIGGTNAHIILEEPPITARAAAPAGYSLIVNSAKNERSLEKSSVSLVDFLNSYDADKISALSYTLLTGRAVLPYRRFMLLDNVLVGKGKLSKNDIAFKTLHQPGPDPDPIFIFPGGGTQYIGMGRELYGKIPFFTSTVDEGIAHLSNISDLPYLEYLLKTATDEELGLMEWENTEIALPLLFIVEYALARQLMQWGLVPKAMIGHSLGEYVAACIAEVFSYKDALKVVLIKARLMNKAVNGAMLSISSAADDVYALLGDTVDIAAINTPANCVIAGSKTDIARMKGQLEDLKIEAKIIPIAVASHSRLMEPILREFELLLSQITFNLPTIPYISNVTGTWITDGPLTAKYWSDHLRSTVQFSAGIQQIRKRYANCLFIETGPGNILSNYIKQHGFKTNTVNVLRHHNEVAPDDYYLLNKLGELWLYGCKIDWEIFFDDNARVKVSAPTYKFDRQRYWIDKTLEELISVKNVDQISKKDSKEWFYYPSWYQKPAINLDKDTDSDIYLLIAGDSRFTGDLVKEFRSRKLRTEIATTFSFEGEGAAPGYIYNEKKYHGVNALLGSFNGLGLKISKIIMLTGVEVTPGVSSANDIKKVQAEAFYPLLSLGKAIAGMEAVYPIDLYVITSSLHNVLGDETNNTAYATLLGPVKTIAQENPHIKCKNIDIGPFQTGTYAANTLKHLCNEIQSSANEPIIALRNGKRWALRYEMLDKDGFTDLPAAFKDGGTYLVTGGLGRIGFTVLEYLSSTYKLNIIITGRTSVPEKEHRDHWISTYGNNNEISKKIEKIRILESKGSTVVYLKADVCQAAEMKFVINHVLDQFGSINGIIHCTAETGIENFQAISELGDNVCEAHFNSKIYGLIALRDALAGINYDFCLLMSSISSVLGGLGFTAYSAANSFMDYFADQMCQTTAKRWVSVCWDGWEYLEDRLNQSAVNSGMIQMTVEEGPRALEHILRTGINGTVVHSLSDLTKRIETWVGKANSPPTNAPENEAPGQNRYQRPDILTAYKPPVTKQEKMLVEIWSDFFKYDRIGIDDSFFELGGNSLKGIAVIDMIHKQLKVRIPIKEFFTRANIAGIAAFIKDGANNKYNTIPGAECKEYYPLSSAQLRLYLVQNASGGTLAYNETYAFEIRGKIDNGKLNSALQQVINNHSIFRTQIIVHNDQPVQRILNDVTVRLQLFNSGTDTIVADIGSFVKPFDLKEPPYLRVGIYCMAETHSVLVLDIHHIVTDGISVNNFLKELSAAYSGNETGKHALQYCDYAEWQMRQKRSPRFIQQKQFWLEEFSGKLPKLDIPADYSRPQLRSFEGAVWGFQLPEVKVARLFDLASKNSTSLYMVLLAIYNILLWKLSSQTDIIIGTPTSGRTNAALDSAMGIFVNTLVLRNQINAEQSFSEFLGKVNDRTLKSFDNQEYQYEQLVEDLKLVRNPSANPLFDVVFTYQNMIAAKVSVAEVEFIPFNYSNPSTKFDLILAVAENDKQLQFSFNYSTTLFREGTIKRFAGYFETIVDFVVNSPSASVKEVDILPQDIKNDLLQKLSDKGSTYPEGDTVLDIFEAQVQKYPDNVAIVFENESLTYKELDERATRLSIALREKGIKDKAMIALYLGRSLDTICCIIAVIKAGYAYLPIDINSPNERVNYILSDSAAPLLMTTTKDAVNIKTNCDVILVDDPSLYTASIASYVQPSLHPDDLLYVIYTSGTTGKPKGVMIEHRNVVRLLFNSNFQFDFNETDVWTLFHSYAFDFSVWEMYGALLYGGKLVVVSNMVAKDNGAFLELLQEQGVTVLNQTPMSFYNVANTALKSNTVFKLKYVIFGGEALAPGKLEGWLIKFPSVKLINMYGITETTVHVTFKEIGHHEVINNISNIGTPIPTLDIYITDEYQKLKVPGVAGELCVGGLGVARGYLNRPDLTAERFVDSLFKPGEKLYRSGDLVRMLENGELEYLGRIDSQVKIRGYRIELAEVDHHITLMNDITEAVTVVIENDQNEKSLCAYFVSPGTIDIEELRSHLRKMLPDYMLPAYLMQVDHIPLTNNGKIDRGALPKPVKSRGSGTPVMPRNPVEQEMTAIWKKALDLDEISITDSFFYLGGDSIKAIRLVNQINDHFKTGINLADLYLNESIEKISSLPTQRPSVLMQGNEEVLQRFEQLKNEFILNLPDSANIDDVYPMTEIESGMFFNYLKNSGSGVYHDQFLFNLRFENFSRATFDRALKLLVDKHGILRSGFNVSDIDKFTHIVYKTVEIPLHHLDYSAHSAPKVRELIDNLLTSDIQNVFKENDYPLWRIVLVKRSPEHFVLILIFHHAILDGWSVASFMTELNNTYYRLIRHPTFVPAPLKATHKDAALDEEAGMLSKEKISFWQQELSGYQRTELSFMHNHEKQCKMLIFKRKIDVQLLNDLKATADRFHSSVKNILFAAYTLTLNIFSDSDEIVTGWVTNNRPLIADGDKILGCFLNTIPIRLKVPKNTTYASYIELVNKRILELRRYESVPLFQIAKAIGEKSGDRNPIFDSLFNFVDFHIYNETVTEETIAGDTDEGITSDGNQNTNTLFDFEVSVTNNELYLLPKYDPALVNEAVIEKFCEYYYNILQKILYQFDDIISSSGVMPAGDRHRILYDFNETLAHYDRNTTLPQLFQNKVSQQPNQIAVIQNGLQITYAELNVRANQMAFALRGKGVRPGMLVGVLMNRSIDMIVSMMAILKAGGAYVPMEPNLPDLRIIYIMDSLGISSVVTSGLVLPKLMEIGEKVKTLENIFCPDIDGHAFHRKESKKTIITRTDIDLFPVFEPEALTTPDDIAYIIFTSGSTGVPKGVVVKHKPVVNVIEWVNKTFGVSSNDKLLFINSIGFDLSVYDIFGVLAAGATVRLLGYDELSDPGQVLNIIIDEKITIWDSAPAAMQLLVPLFAEIQSYKQPADMRLIMLSGDWVPVTLPDILRDAFKNAEVISLGGATEATIWSNYFRITKVQSNWKSIPYGKPMQNCQYYILNNDLDICPVGVAGDLYIGGECLSSGYINDIGLTSQKFISHPFDRTEIIYKTGDLARWFDDGNMEFLGRKDGQVKIRGFRVELGEIESILLKHDTVQNAVVLPYTTAKDDKYLCAYVVFSNGKDSTSVKDLKQYLSEWVSYYMIPDFFITLPEIPVTVNGKVDRKLLPAPTNASANDYVAPMNETEATLTEIWADILSLPSEISVLSDFFEIGGHSLNVTILIAQIKKRFNAHISIREIFTNSTIRSQSSLIGIISPQIISGQQSGPRRRQVVI